MARNEKRNRGTIKNFNKVNFKQAEVFLYGKLNLKSKAVGYCDLHKCYLDTINVSEKRCRRKHCKYFKEVK